MFIFLIFLIIFLLLSFIADRFIRNRFNINIEAKKRRRWVNECHRDGEILIIISFILFWLLKIGYIDFHYGHLPIPPGYRIQVSYLPDIPTLILILLIVLGSFRAFMEWKFEKESKQYILSLINPIFVLIILIGLYFFLN